ncbi:MAG: GNAT family N-acetyltransferase [Halioglobus sp.]
MESRPVIHDGQPQDLALLSDIFSDSFSLDPIMNWVIPMPQLYRDFFKLLIDGIYLPKGLCHLEDQGRGASLWLPPNQDFEMPLRFSLLSMVCRLIARKGLKPLKDMRAQGDFFAQHHPSEPHYYLQFIGVKQQHQGQGSGSALLKHGTRLCDEQQMPAYLESSNILNVPLYQRHGFEVIHEGAIPGGGPTAWFMWREPQ